MLSTMPDLKWTVRVHRWTWIYSFTRIGTVSWLDPSTGMSGRGTWQIENRKLITRWAGSKTWEEWDLPISPSYASGECHMGEGSYDLSAVAINYYLGPGDVVYAGDVLVRSNGFAASIIYDDEIRSGGTIAWICRNPGNIREGSRYGAFPGKQLHTKAAGAFAIFPDEATGLRAVVSVFKGFGRVTLKQAMHKYAPKEDGQNDPDRYAAVLAGGLKVKDDVTLSTLSDAQMLRLAELVTGVEGSTKGTVWSRDDPNLPQEVRQRLRGRLSPPTEDELRNSSFAKPW